ncbi:uncharacterized protein LOC133219918 isoform X6 [Neopsephotus bourkii]|uniref:uncharacterized protein LOC133219918 isoform X6 n=1 Tax=Neopsephotus bourkii TaxID=309878 RepID=UPI002AA4FFCD|nr:uncharacterized protein LOC133219918 isoform X6 [Neopsephotus bourkii]
MVLAPRERVSSPPASGQRPACENVPLARGGGRGGSDDFDELVVTNNEVVLKNIAEDLRNRLPMEAMFNSEHQAVQKIHQHPLPMIHVDAFLYDDDFVDSLCEEGKMSRSYCTECGSYKTASLEFISHSFSLMELKFLYQHVLPDLTGKVVVDVGSRLGAVLFAGYLYSSASQLYGVEMNADFCQLQEMMVTKYQFIDRIKLLLLIYCEASEIPVLWLVQNGGSRWFTQTSVLRLHFFRRLMLL